MLANHKDLLREMIEEKEYRKAKIKMKQEDMIKALIKKGCFTVNEARYFAHRSGLDVSVDVQMPEGYTEYSNCFSTWEQVGIEQVDYLYRKVIGD